MRIPLGYNHTHAVETAEDLHKGYYDCSIASFELFQKLYISQKKDKKDDQFKTSDTSLLLGWYLIR